MIGVEQEQLLAAIRRIVREEVAEAKREKPPPLRVAPSMLTVAQVAERTGFKAPTITEWCRSGKLASKKVGGRYRVALEDLERFIAAGDKPAEAAEPELDARRILATVRGGK